MGSNNKRSGELSRRTVLGGIGGTGIASLAGLPALTAGAGDGPATFETSTHTRETFQSIVDAIVPETPSLADELGAEHEPGGLDVDLEEFLIWNYNNSEELRAEGLSWLVASALSIDVDESDLEEILADVRDDHSTLEGYRVRQAGLTDVDTVFGSLRGLEIDVERPGDEGTVDVEYVSTTTEETADGESVTSPYAPVFAAIFDLVALEFVARGELEDDVEARSAFDGGGAFVHLSARNRLRCLEWLFGGEPVEALEEELAELIATLETMPGVVMTLQILTVMGYYSEWAGDPGATGVEYRDTWTGETGEIEADVVVMAAGCIETPRLWLNSDLSNNGKVGTGLTTHWFDFVTGVFDEETADEHGPVADVTWEPHPDDDEKRDQLAETAAELLQSAGTSHVHRADAPPLLLHLQSSMRMGEVVDENCEAYDVDRLFVGDHSAMANGLGGPNPTNTGQALALRTAEKIEALYF